jgi:hypothetical protein
MSSRIASSSYSLLLVCSTGQQQAAQNHRPYPRPFRAPSTTARPPSIASLSVPSVPTTTSRDTTPHRSSLCLADHQEHPPSPPPSFLELRRQPQHAINHRRRNSFHSPASCSIVGFTKRQPSSALKPTSSPSPPSSSPATF